MKSQIFAGIALLIAGVYTVEINKVRKPEFQATEPKIISTEEIIQQSSLNKMKEEIEQKQDSTSDLIRETVKDDIIDSVIVPSKDSIPK